MKGNISIFFLYGLLIATGLFFLQFFTYPGLLSRQNFLHWDAEHYYWIRNNGYEGFRVAFFPLFPLLWKILHLGIYGIVLFNLGLFLTSFYYLCKVIQVKPVEVILYLSTPGFFFFILPYSESVFFASSVLLLVGLKNKNNAFTLVGLFLSTLSRPAFTVFIPALIVCKYAAEGLNKKFFTSVFMYVLTAVAGLILVAFIQHHYTGEWFKFFSVQKGWGNELQLPKFPLTTWGGDFILKLDSSALLVGGVSGIVLLIYLLKSKSKRESAIPAEVLFSLAYLAGISLTVLFFRGGSLFSLNRFVFATPFIVIALNFYFQQNIVFTTKQLLQAFLLLNVFWLTPGSFVHIQVFLSYIALSLFIMMFLVVKSGFGVLTKFALPAIIVVNIILQITLMVRFLNGGWVG